jgi:DnaJ-class molecular chaperone
MDDRPRYMISVAAELVGMHPQILRMRGNGKGDVLASLKMVVPEKPTRREKELLEELRKVQRAR